MINVSKIKISINAHDYFEYEKDKAGVKSINILQDEGIITVEFEEEHEWDYKLFPISHFSSIDYKTE